MAEREDEEYEDSRPTGMTVREQERQAESPKEDDSDTPEQPNPHHTVSDKIEREMVSGGHGHGGLIDLELEDLESELH